MGEKRNGMMGMKSRSICVKFREDDPKQIAAWEYLTNERGSRTYAEMIAELIKEKAGQSTDALPVNRGQSEELLTEIRHICLDIKDTMARCAVSPVGDGMTGTDPIPEKMAHKAEITEGAANLMRQLSGEDEE